MRQHTISRYHADPVVILVCYVQIANARHFDSIWIIEFGKRGNAIRKSLRAAGISCDQPYDINTKYFNCEYVRQKKCIPKEEILRMRWFELSETKTFPRESTATSTGFAKNAFELDPSANARDKEPARVLTIPKIHPQI